MKTFKTFSQAKIIFGYQFPMLSGMQVENLIRKKIFKNTINLENKDEARTEISRLWSSYERRILVSRCIQDKHNLIGLMNSVMHKHKEFIELDNKLYALFL